MNAYVQKVLRYCLVAVCCAGVGFASAQTATKKPRIAFISSAKSSSKWWDPVKNGIAQAAEDFGVDVDFITPADGELDGMIKIINEIDPSKYAAVVSTMPNPGRLRNPLAAMVKEKRLPLITTNSGTQEDSEAVGAILHVGQPEELAGRLAGEQARKAGATSFVCIVRSVDNAATKQRCEGFAKGLGVAGPVAMFEPQGKDAEAEASIAKFIEGAGPVNSILTTGLNEAIATMGYLRKSKNSKKPHLVTFDLSKEVATGVTSGLMDFAIDQQPYLQGYLPVAVLARKLKYPEESALLLQIGLFSENKLHVRASKYGLSLKPSNGRHILSGPAFVTRLNVDKVDQYIGQYR
nr:substrate-binding domain-containing protein [Curvibacter sp. CHRR-16]